MWGFLGGVFCGLMVITIGTALAGPPRLPASTGSAAALAPPAFFLVAQSQP
jgi:hypothetical protein